MASPAAVLRTSIAAARGGAGDAGAALEGVSAHTSTICGLCCCRCSAQDQSGSWQPWEGAVLPLPTTNGKVKEQSAVFLLFLVVPSF